MSFLHARRPSPLAADFAPSLTPRNVAALFLLAVVLRAAIYLAVTFRYHVPLDRYTAKGDGESYLAVARAMLTDRSHLTEYDRRVFPGYPALIALVHCLGLPYPVAALTVDWIAAGAVAAASAMLFKSFRIGLATVMLFPHYVTNSSMAMSEAPTLALATAGLLLASRAIPVEGDQKASGSHLCWGRLVAAGLLMGAAGLVRPMACFAAMGFIALAVARRRVGAAVVGATVAAGVVLLGILMMQRWTGDVFEGVRIYKNAPNTYGGRLLGWPFESLIMTPLRPHASVQQPITPGYITYIWVHVALVLSSIALLGVRCARGWKARSGPWTLDVMALIWLAGNTAFVLCVGSYWGFLHFPRFTIPALPAFFSGLSSWLPRRLWPWLAWLVVATVMVLATAMAVLSVRNSP